MIGSHAADFIELFEENAAPHSSVSLREVPSICSS